MTFHHVGCLVKDMEEARTYYGGLFAGRLSRIFRVASQSVDVCFVETGPDAYLELVCPTPAGQARFTAFIKRQTAYYHIGYLTPDFEATLVRLRATGHTIIEDFHSEAFFGRRCAFLMSPLSHVIELIEAGPVPETTAVAGACDA